MTANLFDDGDLQRLTREQTLTEEAPRQLPQDDRSPPEDNLSILAEARPEPDFAEMLAGLLLALERKLQ